MNAADSVKLSGTSADGKYVSGLFTSPVGPGAAGDLTINTRQLIVQDGAEVTAQTNGAGNAGSLTVNAADSVELSGTSADVNYNSGLFTETRGTGAAGDLTINTRQLIIRDGANASTSSLGAGNAGSLTVNASDSVKLIGTSADGNFLSALFAEARGAGAAGDLTIATGKLIVQDGGRVSAGTVGQGNSGNIQINASNGSVDLSGVSSSGFSSGLFTNTSGVGQAGTITVNSSTFRLADGAVVSASTRGKGDITNNSNAFRGGNININANTFDVANGGQLRTTTSGTGRAGDITLKVLNNITLQGQNSGIFANTTPGSTGSGGSIVIDPNQLKLTDGARVAVDSRGTGQGGSLNVQANYLTLDNQASLLATTNSSEGGNITLNVPSLLLMRHNSGISATAGVASGSGNGGNITINTPFIVSAPLENSDITANARSGKGGNVNINAQGIFWLDPRSKEQLQTLLNTQDPTQLDPSRLPTNDITAISQQGSPLLSGQVTINTSGIDPSRGLVPLPAVVVDKSGLIAQGCAAGNGTTGSQFVITGRGGLPPNPSEPLSSDAVWSDTRLPATTVKKHHSQTVTARKPSKPAAVPIVPATGWVFNGKGEVTLTATAPSDTIQIPWFTPTSCHAQ